MAGIYIHIPFCKQACHYCNFHFSTSLKKKDELLSAIHHEIVMRKLEIKDEQVETIYFGGGTPSLLADFEVQSLINAIHEHYDLVSTPEVTLEANPDDLSSTYLKKLSRTPINRLSIGIQSFFEKDLKLMNRSHNAKQARASLEDAAMLFKNISIDLIYGIQYQSDDEWQQNLEIASHYEIPHISSYALTVEPKTAMKAFIEKQVLPPVDDDQAQRQFLMLVDYLDKQDFVHYEISNFGKEGFFSKNNSAYWQGKNYLGLGPSAHSFNGKQRFWNVSNNTQYIKSIKANSLPFTVETLTSKDRYNEYIMTGLRTIWGVSLYEIEDRFGDRYVSYFKKMVEPYIHTNVVYEDNAVYKTTKEGKFLADGIASHLFMI